LKTQRAACGSHDSVIIVTGTKLSPITWFSQWSWCTRPWADFNSEFYLVFEKKRVGIKTQAKAVITIATLAILILNLVVRKYN
jgi:hypothetical protein